MHLNSQQRLVKRQHVCSGPRYVVDAGRKLLCKEGRIVVQESDAMDPKVDFCMGGPYRRNNTGYTLDIQPTRKKMMNMRVCPSMWSNGAVIGLRELERWELI